MIFGTHQRPFIMNPSVDSLFIKFIIQGGAIWPNLTTRTSFLPRDAMLSAVYAVVVCLCVCVCVSVTLRYCIKTAKRRITQTTPHDSTMTLVF